MITSADISDFLNIKSLFFQLEKITTVLMWTCDTNVPGKNSQKTAVLLIKRLAVVPQLYINITLKVLLGLALKSHQSIQPLSRKIEMLGGSNSNCCPYDP